MHAPEWPESVLNTRPPLIIPPALAQLAAERRWVVWRLVRSKSGKLTKPPFRADNPGVHASSTDPLTWCDLETAMRAYTAMRCDGIGFVLTGSDIGAVDLDDCRDPGAGVIHPWALDAIDRSGSYAEVTPSKEGARIIGFAAGNLVHRKFAVPNANGAICELYRRAERYITITGQQIGAATSLANIDVLLDELLAELDGAQQKRDKKTKSEREDGPQKTLHRNVAGETFHGSVNSECHGAREIAAALGGQRAQRLCDGGYLVPCPVPSHGKGRGDRKPSLRISDGETRLLVHCYAGCDPRDVLDVLRRRGLLDRARSTRISDRDRRAVNAQADRRRPREGDDLARIRCAREIWDAGHDPRGTMAEDYLRLRRLALDDVLASRVLRFHPRTPWRNENNGQTEYLPALIAAFRSLDDGEITGIHRIALKPNGEKLGKRMLGIVHRTAIKLDDDVGDELAIGEGVETCIAARLLGIRPAWALGSVGGIAHFPVLPGIRVLRIIGENDQGISADAIDLCGPRWQAAGCRVRIIKPPLNCKDLNDALGAHA